MRVDVHAHYYPDEFTGCLTRLGVDTTNTKMAPGAGVTIEQRVDLLDKVGIRVQVLCVGANQPYFDREADAVSTARLANDLYAKVCQGHGGRFESFATVPLPHVDAALAELERALDTLGMVGVALGCSVKGQPLDDAAFEPFFAELNKRNAVVFLHPQGIGCGPLVESFSLAFTLGAPFEDTIAALRLVLSGITTRYPNIRVIVPHLGGTLPFLLKRMDESLSGRAEYKPSEHLGRMWFDTVNNHTASLQCSRDTFGADRLLLGTDFPHLAGERFERSVSYIQDSGLPAEEKTAILDRNAQALLGLKDR